MSPFSVLLSGMVSLMIAMGIGRFAYTPINKRPLTSEVFMFTISGFYFSTHLLIPSRKT